MPTTPRPLPRTPPPHLTFVQPVEVRSYRPLPTPPLRSPGSSSISSVESVYPQTPPPPPATRYSSSSLPSFTSLSSTPSELLPRPRLKLRIAPVLRRRNSLDSPTVRSPALCDPGQTYPVVDRWPSSPKRAPHIQEQFNQVSVAHRVVSPMVFQDPAIITESDVPESDGDGKCTLVVHFQYHLRHIGLEPVSIPHIPQPNHGTSDSVLTPQPPRSQPPPTLTDQIENYSLPAIRAVADATSDTASDDKIVGLGPRIVSSIDLSNGHKSHASNRSWKPFSTISKVAMKSHLLHRKTRSAKLCGAPVADAKRVSVSQIASPLDQTWYKEQNGWRWVERDIGEVLAELRKLR
jgi:hypothetical protein